MAYIFHYVRSPLEIMCIAFIVLLLENTKLFYTLLLFCLDIEILSVSSLFKSLIANVWKIEWRHSRFFSIGWDLAVDFLSFIWKISLNKNLKTIGHKINKWAKIPISYQRMGWQWMSSFINIGIYQECKKIFSSNLIGSATFVF